MDRQGVEVSDDSNREALHKPGSVLGVAEVEHPEIGFDCLRVEDCIYCRTENPAFHSG